MAELIPLVAILTVFVFCPWLFLHYAFKRRDGQGLSREDEKMLEDLWQLANRMERRVESLETILDAKAPNWREKS